jgi:hypothetical protein
MINATLEWKSATKHDLKPNQAWCENGISQGKVYFQLYHDEEKKETILNDLIKKQTYNIEGGKAIGYNVAFRLFKNYT